VPGQHLTLGLRCVQCNELLNEQHVRVACPASVDSVLDVMFGCEGTYLG
jgi:hypothetical protein